MNYRIIGTTLPVLELQLNPGEGVFAVSGELSWMNSAISSLLMSDWPAASRATPSGLLDCK